MSTVDLPRASVAVMGGVVGIAITLVFLAISENQPTATASTIATLGSAIVAFAVGIIPWLISRDDRKSRAIVVSSRIAHELQVALRHSEVIRDGLGHAAETADSERIKESARRCSPPAPQTLDDVYNQLSCFSAKDATTVCKGVMAAIDQYTGIFMIANTPIEEFRQACRMQIISDLNGHAPSDLDQQAENIMGKQMMQLGRRAAARTNDARIRIPAAIEVLRQYGAVMPSELFELHESPIPEIAAAVKSGKWPPTNRV